MDRRHRFRTGQAPHWDIAIIGGGATGLGVALDAAARGFSVVLVESHDFAKGTSSRATKLVHGGVRYLAQGNIALVREALHERTTLLANAPHIAQPLGFVVPRTAGRRRVVWRGPEMLRRARRQSGAGATEFLMRASEVAAPAAHRARRRAEGRHQVLGRAIRRCTPGDGARAHGRAAGRLSSTTAPRRGSFTGRKGRRPDLRDQESGATFDLTRSA